jgi:hypothetical protein
VRQKEIQDAKEAQLEDAKKIRELKEHNEQLEGLKEQLQRLRQDNDKAKQEVVKAAADSTVRQKEIQDAKEAQLEDAKKIRELKEHNQQANSDLASALAEVVGLKQELAALKLEHKKKLEDGVTALQEEVCKGADKHTSIYTSTYLYMRISMCIHKCMHSETFLSVYTMSVYPYVCICACLCLIVHVRPYRSSACAPRWYYSVGRG